MIVGVDIGGTKTHVMAERGDGSSLERTLKTVEWRGRTNAEADALALASLIEALCDSGPADIVVVGSHGCDSDEERLALQQRLSRHFAGQVLVLNDSELLLPAIGKISGISVIAGTGSIAVSRDGDRQMIAAGGWGWYLGDEGSASGLVREAARAVRASLDSGAALDPLGRALLDNVGVHNPIELGRALGAIGSAAGIGAFARLIFEAAESGSALALQVIDHGGRGLALLVERLLARGAPRADVVAGGGVVTRQPRLLAAFRAALAQRAPDLALTLVEAPPVLGALILARALQQGDMPPSLPLPHRAGQPQIVTDGRAA